MFGARFFKLAGLGLLLFFGSALGVEAAQDPLPVYDCTAPNVEFWTQVYTRYSTSQGIIHDSTDLAIIYEIIPLKPYDVPGARKVNQNRIKQAKARYQRLLKTLARNPAAGNEEARRIVALFGGTADKNVYEQAAGQIRCQIGQKDRFQAGLIRSGAYLEEIKEIFRNHGLPEELAYLPHVESSFNTNAYSKFGAAGMWQFTRPTGKRFMEVGYVLDERRDPIRAAHAAAQLLKENYEKLGSWPLAVTAYNHGTAGMQKAKEKYRTYENIFKYYHSRLFKFASRNFYSEFLAARSVADNYQTYFDDVVLDQPAPTHTIALKGYVSLEDVCRHFGLSPQKVKVLNPALRPPVFNGQKHIPRGYTLRLPSGVTLAAAESSPLIPDALYRDTQKPSRFYTVQRGDTAGKIASNHGVRLSDLILANNLDRRATLYPRQNLRIPIPGEPAAQADGAPPAAEPPVVLAQNSDPVPQEPPAAVEIAEAAPPPQAPQPYPQPELASIIPISLITIEEPKPSPQRTEAVEPAEPNFEVVTADVQFEKLTRKNNLPVGIVRVEVEETLGHYAEWAAVPTWRIRKLNGLPYGRVLRLHQSVKIPLDKVGPEQFVENRYEYHKRLQEDFFAVYRIGELQSYTVQSGDNYWTLGTERFEIPLWLLKQCNPEVDLADLRFHQKLWVPSIEKVTQDDPIADYVEDAPEASQTPSEQ
jgi:membrane-bound lytic murein transglycosylase D